MIPEDLYPEHIKKLEEAELLTAALKRNNFDDIEKGIKSIERKNKKDERERKWQSRRNTYFVVGACNRWPYKFQEVFERFKKEFKLP